MLNTLILANSLLFFGLFGLSLALLYYIIKVAVRHGVEQANERLVESVREIERSVLEIKLGINKKESN